MKKYFIVFTLLLCKNIYCQNPEIKTDLPTIIPPSPTVAALMKFEEVPVSNYTGVPDISIPLYSTSTRSKDINLDISLKYHSGVGANDRSSDVGLGWSLFAGGTISRTVRGLPDEILLLAGGAQSMNGNGKVGIYQTSVLNHINNYYYFTQNIANSTQDSYAVSVLNPTQAEIANEFLWECADSGRYDTEHDLWQFNFMGFSGRFYIKKNITTNQLEVIPLEDYRIKIINNYAPDPNNINNLYIPTGFTVYDEKGYKYIFDVIEKTKNFSSVSSIYISTEESISNDKFYNSSFHLSKIYSPNNELIIEYIFNQNVIKECIRNSTMIINDYDEDNINVWMENYNCLKEFKPFSQTTNNHTLTDVKKIKYINVFGKAKIELGYTIGRNDTNIQIPESTGYLSSLIIRDWKNNFVKKYNFDFTYSHVIDTRMILNKIDELNNEDLINGTYKFFYENNDVTNGFSIGKDYWGYFNLIQSCSINNTMDKEVSPTFSTTDLLQKIKYPTGGCAIFNYETNQYSFIGDNELVDFNENPYNFTMSNSNLLSFNNSTVQLLPISTTEDRKVKFYSSIVFNEVPNLDSRNFTLLKQVNGDWVSVKGLGCPYWCNNCCVDFILQKDIQYGIRRDNMDVTYSGIDTIKIEYFTHNTTIKKFLFGGGNRIKQIGYFDTDVSQNYYKQNSATIIPNKEKKYDYFLSSGTNKSSGSLVFAKPLFEYEGAIQLCTNCSISTSQCGMKFGYKAITSFNNQSILKTHGADVGYKYVSVSETNNGRTDFEYTSPIDFPEDLTLSVNYPFLPSVNYDYKRGLLLKENSFNYLSKKVSENEYNYTFDNFETQTGLKIFKPLGVCFSGSFFNKYSDFKYYIINSLDIWGTNGGAFIKECNGNLCGLPIESHIIMIRPIKEAYGWAKLTSKNTKNYFYPSGSTTPNITQTDETYDYNPINKKISESTVTNSLGDVLKTKYYYHSGNSSFSQNRISEIEKIEKYKGTELLSTSKINYVNNWSGNVSFLPQSIVTSKGSNTLESKIKYNKYDEYSNPLEVQQDSGVITSYIYGYNKTQPVAKLENIAYNSIPAALITAIQTATDSATSTEAQVIAALNALRSSTDANMVKAMITTYTYIPLVGVSTITDPKGDTQTFSYDSFGRLQNVKDKNANILSENEYHYRP